MVSGRGMALAQRQADEIAGYTRSDEATFRQLEDDQDQQLLY
jgi:ABC-type tungstate transport system permease subunit